VKKLYRKIGSPMVCKECLS